MSMDKTLEESEFPGTSLIKSRAALLPILTHPHVRLLRRVLAQVVDSSGIFGLSMEELADTARQLYSCYVSSQTTTSNGTMSQSAYPDRYLLSNNGDEEISMDINNNPDQQPKRQEHMALVVYDVPESLLLLRLTVAIFGVVRALEHSRLTREQNEDERLTNHVIASRPSFGYRELYSAFRTGTRLKESKSDQSDQSRVFVTSCKNYESVSSNARRNSEFILTTRIPSDQTSSNNYTATQSKTVRLDSALEAIASEPEDEKEAILYLENCLACSHFLKDGHQWRILQRRIITHQQRLSAKRMGRCRKLVQAATSSILSVVLSVFLSFERLNSYVVGTLVL